MLEKNGITLLEFPYQSVVTAQPFFVSPGTYEWLKGGLVSFDGFIGD